MLKLDLYQLASKEKELKNEMPICLRARIQESRITGRRTFFILRDGVHTIQCVLSKKEFETRMPAYDTLSKVQHETCVEIEGTLNETPFDIKSCSFKRHEIVCKNYQIINEAVPSGFQINSNFIHPNPDVQHDMRVLDLRNQENQQIFRIKSKVLQAAMTYLWSNDFIQIQTPKLTGSASEGGANVFGLDYFGRDAYLAQSPQLFKQMALNSEFPRVFEVGPVFRAENSNSIRHLTEFTGMDLEMRISENYREEVFPVLWGLLKHISDKVGPELENKVVIPEGPLVLDYNDGIDLLNKHYEKEEQPTLAQNADLTGSDEKMLGKLVKEEFGSDLFILDNFPTALRPFYTMTMPGNPQRTRSYDFILNGMEILSGAQRIHNHEELLQSALVNGVNPDNIKHYLDSFKWGAYPHAGGGFGLERICMNLMGLENIRKVSLFYRDPKRLEP